MINEDRLQGLIIGLYLLGKEKRINFSEILTVPNYKSTIDVEGIKKELKSKGVDLNKLNEAMKKCIFR